MVTQNVQLQVTTAVLRHSFHSGMRGMSRMMAVWHINADFPNSFEPLPLKLKCLLCSAVKPNFSYESQMDWIFQISIWSLITTGLNPFYFSFLIFFFLVNCIMLNKAYCYPRGCITNLFPSYKLLLHIFLFIIATWKMSSLCYFFQNM